MRATVRSRLWASAAAFVLGFAVANVGILTVTGPDRWIWLAVSVVLMLTGAVGVLVADTRRPLSLWAVLGVEVLVVLTLLPLLWMLTLATTPEEATATSLWPAEVSWDAFGDVLGSGLLRRATSTSFLVALVSTAVAMLLAVPASYALAQRRVRGRRAVYLLVVASLLLPVVALAGPIADQLVQLGAYDTRAGLLVPSLLVSLPLALWLCTTVMLGAPWSLRDSVRADGAGRRQELRAFGLPVLGPWLVLVTLLVLVASLQDVVLGAALSASAQARPLPATLLVASGDLDHPAATVAATGLLWLIPVLLLVAVVPGRISRLLGRTYP